MRHHGEYWILPLIAAAVWTATLIALLCVWIFGDRHVVYEVSESYVVFISDVGAAHQKLFIAGTALTFFFFTLTLVTERSLRHLRRIPGSLSATNRETKLSIACVVFGIIAGLALLLLSIFNAFAYPTAHWILTAVFVIALSISAILQTMEVRLLEKNQLSRSLEAPPSASFPHPMSFLALLLINLIYITRSSSLDRNHLRRNAIFKLIIVTLAVVGVIIFGATLGSCHSSKNDFLPPTPQCNVTGSVAGAMEWSIGFLFSLYIITFVLDLWPARKTMGHYFDPSLVAADQRNQLHAHKDGRPGAAGGLNEERTMMASDEAGSFETVDGSSRIEAKETRRMRSSTPEMSQV